jgi:hypothetical protein
MMDHGNGIVMRKLEIDDCTIDKGTGKDETGHYST